MFTDEHIAALVRAYRSLSMIADHAENEHGAKCVSAALGIWMADLLAFLVNAGAIDTEQAQTIVGSVVTIDDLLASLANDAPLN